MSAQLWTWLTAWLAPVLATDAPALPSAAMALVGMQLGWGVVLAWMGWCIARWLKPRGPVPFVVAASVFVWAWLPGPFAPTYWLGLAFQAPSVTTVVWCVLALRQRALARTERSWFVAPVRSHAPLVLALMGIALGWALVLDTFALLPLQLYAWGFSPAASALVLLLALLPWVLMGPKGAVSTCTWLVPVAVLVFVVLRLPSGNLWNAVLDPWLWLALHAYVLRSLVKRY